MTRSERLRPVLSVAEEQDRTAARALAQCRRRLQQQEARLAELEQYQADYAQRFRQGAGDGLGAARLSDYRAFLERLGEALRQQQALIESIRAECAGLERRWAAARARLDALGRVSARYHRQELMVRARREQAETDERAARGMTGRRHS
jgi:flagellar FliJ protein